MKRNDRADKFRVEHGRGAVKKYRSGMPLRLIAKHYGVRQVTVREAFRRMKVPLLSRAGQRRKFSYDEAAKLYDDGWSLLMLAEKYGVTRQAVWFALEERGVKMRPKGGGLRRPPPDQPAVRAMLARGFSRSQIMQITGRDRHSLARIETRLGSPGRRSKHYRSWVIRLSRQSADRSTSP